MKEVVRSRLVVVMKPLSQQKCVPCEGGLDPMTAAEIAEMLPQVPGWRAIAVEGVDRLVKAYSFSSFAAAMTFAVAVGEEADRVGHHPELTVSWGRVEVKWWTHAISGLHNNDFIMASVTDIIAAKAEF